MGERYDPHAVEEKWQERWERLGVNRLSQDDLRSAKDPYYNLMMFPYPSAEGLHIGNIYAYTGADANGRFWRLKGKDVFQPMGFDAFGIHSENYALKVGVNPNDLIPRNIDNFTRMLRRFGGMFDWNHTVDTTNPNYYRWTQWVVPEAARGGTRGTAAGARELVSVVQDRARQRTGHSGPLRALRKPRGTA